MSTDFNEEVTGAWDLAPTPPRVTEQDQLDIPGKSLWRGDLVKTARAEIHKRHLSTLRGEWFE